MPNNFILGPLDTDSISICKQDMSAMSLEEQESIIKEINLLFPEKIRWAHDGYFDVVICLRSKNYVLWDGKKLKIKGSALRSSKMEKALKDFHLDIIWAIIKKENNFTEIYNKYVKEALNIQDIKRWASKRSISEKVLSSDRTNEEKVRNVIEGTEYVEGDKIHVFFREDKSLCLVEHFNGEYDRLKLCKRLFDCAQVFEDIMDTKSLFINYSLKRNQKALELL